MSSTTRGLDSLIAAFGAACRAGLRMALEQRPDLIVADLQMPGLSGIELKQALAQSGNTTPLILVTAEGSETIASQATRPGAT